MTKIRIPETIYGFDTYRLFDIAVRTSLGVFFAFTAGIYYRNTIAVFHEGGAAVRLDEASVVHALAVFTGGLYTMMVAGLYVLRYRPINKFAGFLPSLAAVLGGFLMFGLVWFPQRTDLPLEVQMTASGLILAGNVISAYILFHLGRSFSILPEGRKLVVKGPYKIIRHPLYMAEFLATLGTMVLFLSVGAVILAAVQTALQIMRIVYEERVLTTTFPAYKAYVKKTARLIPGIY